MTAPMTVDLEAFLAARCACPASHAVTGHCTTPANVLVRVGTTDVPMCQACLALTRLESCPAPAATRQKI
jgi:hypothetical protein